MTVPVLLAHARVDHPEFLTLPGRPLVYRVDDPGLRALTEGDPLLGWEGDFALALYIDGVAGDFVLARYCPDGEYRELTSQNFLVVGSDRIAGYLVLWLIQHDPHRGWDPLAEMARRNQKVVDDADKALVDEVEGDLAPRLAHALKKDGL